MRLSLTFKLFLSLAIAAFVLSGSCRLQTRHFKRSFSQLKIGNTRQMVDDLMDGASEIRNCRFHTSDRNYYPYGDCVEISYYSSVFYYWAIAFDKNGKVVGKFHWSLDYDYGKPDEFP